MTFQLDTSEVRRLAGQLASAATRIEPTAEKVGTKAAKRMAETAGRLAPRLTGTLASSIRAKGTSFTAAVDYAGFVEYGTSKTGPQPFIRPAVSKHQDEWVDDLGDAAEQLLA